MAKTILACNSCVHHEPGRPWVHFYSVRKDDDGEGFLDEVIEINCHKCHESFIPVSINDVGVRFFDQKALQDHMLTHSAPLDITKDL